MTRISIGRRTSWRIFKGVDEFQVDFEPVDNNAVIVKIDGDKATVGYLSPDETDIDWYFDHDTEGEYHNIGDRGCKRYESMSIEEIMDLVRENPRRCFWIAKYEHSLSKYYRTGEAITLKSLRQREHPGTGSVAGYHIPDQQWDVSLGVAIFVAPKDAGPTFAKYCDAVMEAFTDWCNGSIYGVCTQEFTRKSEDDTWEPGESNESWQYIGYDHAMESLKEEMN